MMETQTFRTTQTKRYLFRNFVALGFTTGSDMQKLSLLFMITLLVAVSCNEAGNNDKRLPASIITNPNSARGSDENSALPQITFEKTVHDFGRLISGEKVSYSFKFKNTGKGLLLISKVSSSCGCTVPKYPTDPIKPGEEGYITVTFDSTGRMGVQTKTVTVLCNTQPNTVQLTVTSNVITPETLQ